MDKGRLMKKNDVKVGMFVDFKQDIEQSGVVIKLPNDNGDVLIDGPDSEDGPTTFLIHYSRLEEA